MFTVYVLYAEAYNKIYVGYTSDLQGRLTSHNQLATKGYTVKFRPWKVVHAEVFGTKQEAIVREKTLKSSRGRAFIRELIGNGP
ncbi:MAG: GIY-YIG nuclease family protein [Chitinophagales bacterium]|nr:GIY-YIG nuclease family protein [Chitinophagales bacterium]